MTIMGEKAVKNYLKWSLIKSNNATDGGVSNVNIISVIRAYKVHSGVMMRYFVCKE